MTTGGHHAISTSTLLVSIALVATSCSGPKGLASGTSTMSATAHSPDRGDGATIADRLGRDGGAPGTMAVDASWNEGGRASRPTQEGVLSAPCTVRLSGGPPASITDEPSNDVVRAAIPSYDSITRKAAVVDGRIVDCRQHTAPGVSPEDIRKPGPGYGDGVIGTRTSFSLPDGRAATWLVTSYSSIGAETHEWGFLLFYHVEDDLLKIDAIGPWDNVIASYELAVVTFSPRPLYLEPRLIRYTDDAVGMLGTNVWYEQDGEIVLAGQYASRVSWGFQQQGATCGWQGELKTTEESTDHLILRQEIRWSRLSANRICKPEVRTSRRERHFDLVGTRLVERAPKVVDNPIAKGSP